MTAVKDITTFFQTSSRGENDAANKIREDILKIISNPPQEYMQDPEYGNLWKHVHFAWTIVLQRIATMTGIEDYTNIQVKMRGGRKFNYDADIMYYNGTTLLANRKIEFKNGGKDIGDLPQFLSLQTKVGLFAETYDSFWYENYLDQYISCDAGITVQKPPKETYLKNVTSTKYTIHPFFAELKTREVYNQKEKNDVVNRSITDYLTRYGASMEISPFEEKVKATQSDKIYLLWCDGKFHIDQVAEAEMTGMTFNAVRNGNVLELKAGNTIYGLLLRWRNHKGILNPAWQISMKRCSV